MQLFQDSTLTITDVITDPALGVEEGYTSVKILVEQGIELCPCGNKWESY